MASGRRCISGTGRRRSRPLGTVAMQHCKHVMTVATQHNQGGDKVLEWQWGTTSNSDAGCLQVQMTAQIKHMQDEIVALQRQVAILQAHLSDATGYIAVAVHPQLDASPAHSQCAWQGHPSETPRCIAKVIRDAQHAAVVRSRSNSVASHASDNIEGQIQAAQQAAEKRVLDQPNPDLGHRV